MTTSLSDKAMLVHLRISMWTGSRKDKNVTSKVCKDYEAKDDAGSWWTHFIPKKELAEIQTASNKVRSTWVAWTLPWMDGGVRIIPAVRYGGYDTAIKEAITAYNKAVAAFLIKYPSIAADAENRLKKLLDGKRMPSVTEIQSKFGVVQDLLPIPRASDFRLDLPVQQQIETSLKGMSKKAMSDVWEQLVAIICKIQSTLNDPEKKFKNSLIENLREFCNILPQLNLTDDPQLETMRQEAITKLAEIDPEDLRENKSFRKGTAKKAKDVLDKIANVRKIDLDLE